VWCLAVGFNPPGERQCSEGLDYRVRLAVRAIPPGGVCSIWHFLRHFAPGGTRPPLDGVEAGSA